MLSFACAYTEPRLRVHTGKGVYLSKSTCCCLVHICCLAVMLSVCPAVNLSCCQSVLLSVCPAVLLSCCPAVLLSCCPAVLLSCCLAVILSYCHAVILSCCLAVNLLSARCLPTLPLHLLSSPRPSLHTLTLTNPNLSPTNPDHTIKPPPNQLP